MKPYTHSSLALNLVPNCKSKPPTVLLKFMTQQKVQFQSENKRFKVGIPPQLFTTQFFPSIPIVHFGWPNLFAKFSNTHFHVLDFFVSSRHNLSLSCQSCHRVALGISGATPTWNKKWFKVDHGICKLSMWEDQLVQCTNLHAKW
jgi:hypothetical protein